MADGFLASAVALESWNAFMLLDFLSPCSFEHAIHQAKDKAKSQGLENVEFRVQDVYKMPEDWTETFDGVIGFDVLHDFPHPDKAVKELRRVLKVGGILVFRDIFSHGRIDDNISIQGSDMMYAVSLFESMPLSLHSGGIGAGTMWGREKIINCLKSAGFDDVLEPEPGCAQYVCIKKWTDGEISHA